MPMVVTEPCINCKDKSCVEVCPCDCFYEGPEMLVIHPDECIECQACVAECPVEAIFHIDDVPDQWHHYIEFNEQKASEYPPANR